MSLSPDEVQRRLEAEENKQATIVALTIILPFLFCFLFGLVVGIIFF
jgi:hypothetical protein